MTLLWELGEAKQIPEPSIEAMIETLNRHYLKTFPIKEEELPDGCDPYRDIMCHCAFGTVYQVLHAWGVAVDERLPWARPWFLKYQLPDGGLNCDEAAYTKETPKSSIVSTLPPLEAVLFCSDQELTKEEAAFLDRGAEYLIGHKLVRSSKGRLIERAWLTPCFPRFYEYDALRGLRFLKAWAESKGRELPEEAVSETEESLDEFFEGKTLPREIWRGEKTLLPDGKGGWEKWKLSTSFPLLEEVSRSAIAKERLKSCI